METFTLFYIIYVSYNVHQIAILTFNNLLIVSLSRIFGSRYILLGITLKSINATFYLFSDILLNDTYAGNIVISILDFFNKTN